MIKKLSIYFILLLVLPDIYIYKLYIKKHVASGRSRELWFVPSAVLLLGLLWILLFSRGGHGGQAFIGGFVIAYLAVALPKVVFSLCSLVDLPVRRLLKLHSHPFAWLGVVAGAATMLVILYGTFLGRKQFEVKQVVFASPDLPAAFDGYRVAQISDIHAGSWRGDRKSLQKAVDLVNAQQADLIVFTGDLVNNMATELDPVQDILAGFKAPDGVYSVLGNHDYSPYHHWENEKARWENLKELKKRQAAMGWHLLDNRHVKLHRGTDSITLVGVGDDGGRMLPRYSDLRLATLGTEATAFKLLLSHTPTHWHREVLASGIDLTLSGHTHAMQFALGRLSPSALLYPEWSGLYTEGKQGLYVNVGLGYIGLMPLRFGAWPEVTVITLKKSP
ncbi:metallophosphoesterase [Butyricimonas synergistica]|uniref:metallophosphoesterase n=1 Tax=Butyricimonas synergistica TaxID=544644 RepID=UPI00037F237B|nr:metallophosphoesterase [Butyricimonas synergistica]